MNGFYEHHKDSIEFGYRCFDRLLLNGLIQHSRNPNGCWAFSTPTAAASGCASHSDRNCRPVRVLGPEPVGEWGVPIVDAPEKERRDDFVLQYLKDAEADHMASF
jgi:hypothetical protein